MTGRLYIGGRLHSIETGNVVAGANEILDDAKGKKQSQVNAETDAILEDYQLQLNNKYNKDEIYLKSETYNKNEVFSKEETYNKEELNNLITTPEVHNVILTAEDGNTLEDIFDGVESAPNTIYRIGSWDGTQYDPSVYSEYGWDGTEFQFLDKKDYALADASDFDAPDSAKRAKLPTVGAVADVYGSYIENPLFIDVKLDANGYILWAIKPDGTIYYGAGVPPQVVEYIQQKIEELSLDEYENIVAFLNGIEEGENTLQELLNPKANKVNPELTGKVSLDKEIGDNDEVNEAYIQHIESPEFAIVWLTKNKKILFGIQVDGNFLFGCGVPQQVVDYINDRLGEFTSNEYESVVAFLDNIWQGDKTLQELLNEKVDKVEGKSLIDSEFADSQSVVENPEYMQVDIDKDGRILGGRKEDGTKFENLPVELQGVKREVVDNTEWLKVETDKDGKILGGYKTNGKFSAPGGIEEIAFSELQSHINSLDERVDNLEDNVETNEVPYNDLLSIGSKTLKVYNPYKENKQHQYTGQMHFHSWTKFGDSDYPVDFPGEKWEVPYGYSIAAIPAGETNTEKYLWDMPHEKRVAILSALAMAFAWRHKKLGYDFIALSNYAQFQDVTHQPNLSDITYLLTQYPEAYAYFANLYLDGFDTNDFDADGNLKNFHWLCDSYESTTRTLGIDQHIVVHCAPNFSVPYGSGTFKDVMNRVQDYGCIVHWPHPTDIGTYASPEVIATVKKRLRLIEIYDGISIRKYDANGVMTNKETVVSGVMLDDPFDDFLVQGNFLFGMAISDERPTYGRTGSNMFVLNSPKNLKNGCVKVFGDNLTSEELFESLLSGNFYASSDSDVSINSVSIADGKYTVNVGIEGVVVEFLKENNTIVKTVTTSAGNTVASYDIDGSEQFVRARIYKLNELAYDANYWYKNKEWMIWTQPLFISKTIL